MYINPICYILGKSLLFDKNMNKERGLWLQQNGGTWEELQISIWQKEKKEFNSSVNSVNSKIF